MTVGGLYVCVGTAERGVAKVIGGDPKGANFTYTNGKTVIVRDIAVRTCMILSF
jgi:WD repeat-containing protein 1 (actin-interacting protein 1)